MGHLHALSGYIALIANHELYKYDLAASAMVQIHGQDCICRNIMLLGMF